MKRTNGGVKLRLTHVVEGDELIGISLCFAGAAGWVIPKTRLSYSRLRCVLREPLLEVMSRERAVSFDRCVEIRTFVTLCL